jgi:malonate-semialdehyde dehydrogenase (acetylating)/methylmalonate-semialdehyde dehydrogenase
MTTLNNFIDGNFVPSSAAEGSSVPIINPATSEELGKTPLSTSADVDAAVAAGLRAFPLWSELTVKQRAAIMFRFHALVDKHRYNRKLELIFRLILSEFIALFTVKS